MAWRNSPGAVAELGSEVLLAGISVSMCTASMVLAVTSLRIIENVNRENA